MTYGISGCLKVTQKVSQMSVVVLEVGAFVLMAKYVFRKKGSDLFYFRRRIPDDVRRQYPSRTNSYFIESLQTKDIATAAKLAHRKALEQDALWKAMRSGDVTEGPERIEAAKALLDSFGLSPGQHKEFKSAGLEPDEFLDALRFQAGARDSTEDKPNWHEDLPPVHRLAGDLFYGAKEPVFLSAALKDFQSLKGEDESSRAGTDRVRVVTDFIDCYGDLPIGQYGREDANSFVKHLARKGNKTATIQRRINSIRPVFRTMCREYELEDRRIFEGINIPNLGQDTKDRLPYTLDEISMIQQACRAKDDDIRWIIALLSDTGMRLSEATGLMRNDVVLDSPTPHVILRPNEVRRLKTKGSERMVPLVGAALWAVERAIEKAENGFLFPRYIDLTKTPPSHKGTYASNALTKWLRGLAITDKDQKGTHSFRHSVQDRLREAQVPEEIRNVICGWTNKGIGAGYGQGYTIVKLTEHMEKIVIDRPA